MPRKPGIPKYCLHKATGQGLVRIDGRDHYLGTHNSPASKTLYDRLIQEWLARGRRPEVIVEEDEALTVNDVVVAFWDHAEIYYRKPNGKPTNELDNYRQVIKHLSKLYGDTPADEFGPKKLKVVRERMIGLGWCRTNINHQVVRLKSIFRWAAEEELVSGAIYHSLILRQL